MARITGNGGCNRFFGGYTISGNHIKIGPLASTRKGCPGLIKVETTFFATLQAASSFEQTDTTLILFDAAGSKLAQFVRAEEPVTARESSGAERPADANLCRLRVIGGIAVARLVFASLITFGILVGMVVGLVLAAMVAAGEVNLTLAIALTVIINLLIWLISPWLSDLTLRWFNQLEFLDDATVKQRYPGIHQLIHEVADDYRFKAPKIGFIPDRNPTAFTYGLLRSNARIVVTQGIFEFLSPDEQRAVVAHELGHIVNRDFILMTMAGMLVQILYQIYAALVRAAHGAAAIGKAMARSSGSAALVGYYIGIYLLLYLSRTREYLADAFSASRVEPRHLASALIKIAYGIVAIEDTEATQSLLRSTRHLGVIDVKNARYTGLLAESTASHRRRRRRGHAVRHLQSLGRAGSAQLHPPSDRAAGRPSRRDRQSQGPSLRRLRRRGRGRAGQSRPRQTLGSVPWRAAPARRPASVRAGGRPRRRLASGAGGHRRGRAGDAAAALSVPHAASGHGHGADGRPGASPVRGRPVRLDGKAIGRVSPASSPARTSSSRTGPG